MARVGVAYLLATTALSGPIRVGTAGLAAIAGFSGAQQIGASYLMYVAGTRNRIVTAANYLISIASINNLFRPICLESTAQIFGISKFVYTLTAGVIPEHNPYRPTIPESLIELGPDYYDYAKENQEILREQHNLIQAGDSTFPYQLFMDVHDAKHYKLGSVGRFYHEDYGIIQGRYVQFDEMVEVETAHCPVGLFTTKKIGELQWRVTNNLAKSNADLVVGISAAFSLPENGKYGWVIVDGPILQQVKNDSTTQKIGESFTWSGNGSVSNTAAGKVIGRRVNKTKDQLSLRAGQMWVRTESFSEGRLAELIDANTKELQDAVALLQSQIGELPAAAELQTINELLESIQAALTLEISGRKAVDSAIQQKLDELDAVGIAQLNNAIENVTNTFNALFETFQSQLNSVKLIALEALDKANQALSIDLTSILAALDSLQTQIFAIKNRVKGRFPVVDGAIPPNLVYLDDGSLVYVETF